MRNDSPHNGRRPGLIGRLLDRIDNGLFAAEDARAKARGWQVGRGPKGRGRRYRDPRWDSVHRCELCAGSDAACPVCGGEGVIRDDPARTGEADRMGVRS